MHIQSAVASAVAAPYPTGRVRPFANCRAETGFDEPKPVYCARGVPRLIHSVVSEAGLGRFVYLIGGSGKRYVFSSITAEQASLYDKALFATTEPGRDMVRIGRKLSDVKNGTPSSASVLYVHLLDDHSGSGEAVLSDLDGMN